MNCVHGISLIDECERCAESYGTARPTEDLVSASIKTNDFRWLLNEQGRIHRRVLQQRLAGNGGAGPMTWIDVPEVQP